MGPAHRALAAATLALAGCGALVPSGPRDAGRAPRDASEQAVVVAMPDSGASDAGAAPDAGWTSLSLDIESVDAERRLLGVDGAGRMYALASSDSPSRLWTSTDARTWTPLPPFAGHVFVRLSPLSDGVLLADTLEGASHVIARSSDGGATWREVLPLGDRRILQPHSIAELSGEVFLAEYQVATQLPVPINLWASADRGLSWTVRHVFQGYRHAHGLLADPTAGTLWAFLGDPTGAIVRTRDRGASFAAVVPAPLGVIVDAVVTPRGLLFGTDGLYQPSFPRIARLGLDDQLAILADLPGPSYSLHALQPAGFLLGTTREPDGDVYPPGDDAAHLYGSVDGDLWQEVLGFERADPTGYGRLDVYWSLPDGRALVEFANAKGLGTGFLVARPVLR